MNVLDKIIRKVIQENIGDKPSKQEMESSRYMFFSNLEQMKRQCDLLLEIDHNMIEEILDQGHDWAQDHIAEAKNNLDQVFDFLMNETNSEFDDFTHGLPSPSASIGHSVSCITLFKLSRKSITKSIASDFE